MSLSRRTLFLAGLVIALAIAGIWSGPPLQGIWRWPGALLLMMIAWERFSLSNNYLVSREIVVSIALGQESDYQLIISNLGKHRLVLDSQVDYPVELTGDHALLRWTVPAAQSKTKKITITPVALGTISLGKLYLRVLGSYGLVWWTQNHTGDVSVKIEPALLEQTQILPGQVRSGGRQTRYKPGSGFDLLAIRDYHYGDSPRNIDWKATARRNKLMARLFSQEQRLEIAILVDCGRGSRIQCGSLDRLHHYVNIAARLADFAVRHDDRVACMAYVDEIIKSAPMAGGMAALKRTRNLLAGLSPVLEESNPLNVALELQRFLKRRSLVIILTEVEQAEAATQLIQAVHLLAVKHHVLVASIEDQAIADLPLQPVEKWLSPYQNFAALEYSRGRELTRKKLQRSGVSVVTATAEKLDYEVLQYYRILRERVDV